MLLNRLEGPWAPQGVVVFPGGISSGCAVVGTARVSPSPMRNGLLASLERSPRGHGPAVLEQLQRFRSRCTVVGDLMADPPAMPVPRRLCLMASGWRCCPVRKPPSWRLGCRFAGRRSSGDPSPWLPIPVARRAHHLGGRARAFAGATNPIAAAYTSGIAAWNRNGAMSLEAIDHHGSRIHLQEDPPAHGPLSQCALALTTVGANTAELGALGVPMIVIGHQHLG